MARKKDNDIKIKSSGYFENKRANRGELTPKERASKRAEKAEEVKNEAKANIDEMLVRERQKKAAHEAKREEMWQQQGYTEKPRIRVKKGKTGFKPEHLDRDKLKPAVANAVDEPAIMVESGATPKVVITKKGQKPQEKDLMLKTKKDLFDELLEAPAIVVEKAKLVAAEKAEKEKKAQAEKEKQEKIKRDSTKQLAKVQDKAKIDDSDEALRTQRAMLKTKGEKEATYDEEKLAKQAEEKDVHVKSLGARPVKRGKISEMDEGKPKGVRTEKVYRHELKYYISQADYILLRNQLNALLKHDANAGDNGDYYIRSLYFDDYKNSALVDKLAGIENRKKYRVRIYGLKDDMIRLERKNKNKDYISKDNLVLTRKEYDSIIDGNVEFLLSKDSQLAKDFYYETKTTHLKPAVIVDYVREAYVHPIKNLRITIDKVVKSGRYATDIFDANTPLATVLPPGTVVLEIKFQHGLPDYLIGVLNTIKAAQRSAISKYALCRKYES